jgi:hypothetical protein
MMRHQLTGERARSSSRSCIFGDSERWVEESRGSDRFRPDRIERE